MHGDVDVARIVVQKIRIVTLALIHSSDGCARNEGGPRQLFRCQPGFGESLFQCRHAQQCRADGWGSGSDTQPLAKRLIAEFHFAHGKLAVFALQIMHLADTRAAMKQRVQHFMLVEPDGRDDSGARNPDRFFHSG